MCVKITQTSWNARDARVARDLDLTAAFILMRHGQDTGKYYSLNYV